MRETRIREKFFFVELGYDGHKCDSIIAENAIAMIADGAIILKFDLKPRGEGQRIDQDYLDANPLKYVQITDEQVLKGVEALRSKSSGDKIYMEINSKARRLLFRVESVDPQDEQLWQFNVHPI